MDVIAPNLEEIDGISYRINPCDDYMLKNAATVPYTEFGDEAEIGCGREIVHDEDEVEVDYLDDGRCLISFHVPQMFYSHIIGQRGGTKQRLEKDTRTSIEVPKRGDVGDVVITGKTRDNVLAGYRRLRILVATARSKQRYTHFICLPMNSPPLTQNYLRFKDEVLKQFGHCNDIKEGIFQNPAKLHLTVGVMMLADEDERNSAVEALMASKQHIVDPKFFRQGIRVRVRGVSCMNDDPTQVNVLFARLEENSSSSLLQELSDDLVDFFVDKNLMVKEREHVKLHITLMNTRFFNSKLVIDEHADKSKRINSFDASEILEKYKDYDFGEMQINSIHLSQINTEAKDGYYVASCKITFY